MKETSIVVVVPAKGFSQGATNKNTRLLGKKPLLQYTLEAALNALYPDMVCVLTEDDDIKNLSTSIATSRTQSYRGNSIFHILDEPIELSMGHVQVDEAALFALRQLEYKNIDPDTLVILQPSSPFRTYQDIDNAIELYCGINQSVYQAMVFGAAISRHYMYKPLSNGFVEPILHDPEHRLGRQYYDSDDFPIIENGSIYVVDAKTFSKRKVMRVQPMVPYCMDDRASLEIDEEIDFIIAEALLDS